MKARHRGHTEEGQRYREKTTVPPDAVGGGRAQQMGLRRIHDHVTDHHVRAKGVHGQIEGLVHAWGESDGGGIDQDVGLG
jgi:hypothetical protein